MWGTKLKDDIQYQILSIEFTQSEHIDLLVQVIRTLIIVAFIYTGVILGFNGLINLRLNILEGRNLFQYFELYRVNYNLLITFIAIVVGAYAGHARYRSYQNYLVLRHALKHFNFISAENQYHYRIENRGYAHMEEVIDALNHLIASLQVAREEEQRTEASKDELIANVSHDIRTPLTSIVGYLDAVVHHQYQSESEMMKYIQIAYNKANSMRTIVNDLFSYIESGQLANQVDMQPIEMHFLLEQVASEYEMRASKLGVHILTEVNPNHFELAIDVNLMARIFDNLISNALKYGHGNRIRLCAYADSRLNHARIEVRNNGELVEDEDLVHIFDRSFRAEKSRNSTIPGSGLGLSIVKNLVEAQGGTIEALTDSYETIFRMEFPIAKRTHS